MGLKGCGLGRRIQGLGIRVQSAVVGFQGLGSRVRVEDVGFEVVDGPSVHPLINPCIITAYCIQKATQAPTLVSPASWLISGGLRKLLAASRVPGACNVPRA